MLTQRSSSFGVWRTMPAPLYLMGSPGQPMLAEAKQSAMRVLSAAAEPQMAPVKPLPDTWP